mgnify:CR=1 FL=1
MLSSPLQPRFVARTLRDFVTINSSSLFDGSWYVDRYPDVAAAGVDPAMHFVRYGASEGRDPGPAFSSRAYRDANPDVAASAINPLAHYLRHGYQEPARLKRLWMPGMLTHTPRPSKDRLEVLRSLFSGDGRILEIGPLTNPVAPKRDGYRVETVDHLSTEQLHEKYESHEGVDTRLIEEVDHVWRGGPLTDRVTGPDDTSVASHISEHLPVPVGFLLECESLLSSGGALVMAVPDHRRCFDAFRPLSTPGMLKAAHAEARRRHPAAMVYDHTLHAVALDGDIVWAADSSGELSFVHGRQDAAEGFERAWATDEYIDVHGWVFNPQSFRAIVETLWAEGSIGLRERDFEPSGLAEFYVALSPGGSGPGMGPLEMCAAALAAECDTTVV